MYLIHKMNYNNYHGIYIIQENVKMKLMKYII